MYGVSILAMVIVPFTGGLFSDNANTLCCFELGCLTCVEYVATKMAGGHRFIDDLVQDGIAGKQGPEHK